MKTQDKKSVTIEDLASHLNVSHTTVRKALKGMPGISENTRQKVKLVADKMGYYPNLLARSLKQQQSSFLGLVVTKSLSNIWYATLVDKLVNDLKSRGYTVMLSLVDRDDPDEVKKNIEGLLGGHVAGVIAGPIIHQADIDPFSVVIKNSLPLVMFDCIEDLPTGNVAIDHVSGLRQIISHLVECGHSRIGYLCGDNIALPNTRRYGFEKALAEFDLPLYGKDIVPGGMDFFSCYQVTRDMLEDRGLDLPTAYFCHSDICALGAMKAFRETGMKVPDDISLVGYDDIPEASYGYPALTTVGGTLEKMADAMADMLCDSINGKGDAPRKILIEPTLIKRESVARI